MAIAILAGWPQERGGGAPANAEPTDIALSASTIASDAASGTVIGALTATDVDDSSFTWAITNGNTKFELSASTGTTVNLRRSASGTLTAGVNESVTIQVTDSASNIYSEGFVITVPDPSAEEFLETLTISNFSGASRTNPYIFFRRAFEAGDVPSGTHVELRVGSALAVQQADGRTLHEDGSLRMATFSAKSASGALADNATLSVDLYKVSGAFGNSTSISRATLTAQDYRVEVVIDGITYYCLLNNCDAAGAFDEIRAGSCVRAWKHWGILRNGTGASDTDEGQLHARFYSYVWEDGRTTVFPEVINGRVANGAARTVTNIAFKNGAASIFAYATTFTFFHHSAVAVVDTAALPHWSANATDVSGSVDAQYMHDKKLIWYTHSTSTQRSAIGSGSARNYVPADLGEIGTAGVDSAGGNSWIGLMPQWSYYAMLTNDKTRIRNDRINAMSQMQKHNGWYCDHVSGYVPVLNNTNYTADGLSAAQPSIGWSDFSPTITSTGGDPTGAVTNQSHGPEYAYFQYITTGWEWWHDHQVQLITGTLGSIYHGSDTYQRNAIINGAQYRGCLLTPGQSRAIGWALRSLDNAAWVSPDGYPTSSYIRDLLSSNLAYAAEQMTAPYMSSAQAPLSMWETGEGTASGIAVAPWMQNYLAFAIMQCHNRGRITSSHKLVDHVIRFNVGMLAACPYHAMGADRVSMKIGQNPISGTAYAQDWNDVWYGDDGSGSPFATAAKLISDSGGTSGSCPANVGGQAATPPAAEQYSPNTRPSIFHAMIAQANALGLSGATSALVTYMATRETAAGISEASWNDAPWLRMRTPP